MIDIRRDDLSGESTRALLALHLADMRSSSPRGSVFALDLAGLQRPEVAVWTAWIDDEVAGVAALRDLGGGAAEIKSMRTHPDHLRKGVASALLAQIIHTSRARLDSLSLETGSGPPFAPALAFYRAHGFEEGEPFSDYVRSRFNRFLHLKL